MSVAALVLAAGASSRMGALKQLLRDENDETLVHRVARDAIEAGCAPVCVVVGNAAPLVADALSDLDVVVVSNADWTAGLSTSIAAGVDTIEEHFPSITGILMLTCDMPSVGVSHIHSLLQSHRANGIAAASGYGETWGVPALFPTTMFGALKSLEGDRGAKSLLDPSSTTMIPLEGGLLDLDTPEDVYRWRQSQKSEDVGDWL
ncbi:MAG: nucleotidyltransferase family protein [Gemmatimonas sp.]